MEGSQSCDLPEERVLCQRGQVRQSKFHIGLEGSSTNTTQEAETKNIGLVDDEVDIVGLMLEYLYTGDYAPSASITMADIAAARPQYGLPPLGRQFPHTCNSSRSGITICPHHNCGAFQNLVGWTCAQCVPNDADTNLLVEHTKLYELADKYQIAGLKPLIQGKFRAACQLHWAKPEFVSAVEIAFTTTPDEDKGIRSIVVDTLSAHREIIAKPEMEELMESLNGLAYAVLKLMTSNGSLGYQPPPSGKARNRRGFDMI